MREVRIYDSLTREVRQFAPRFPPRVGMFVCGLTPYDEAHIGHARIGVFYDVVARALNRWGYRVFYVQNVTNLDDKLIDRAATLGTDPLRLSDRHFLSWRLSMERLGVRSVNYYPHATDYIPEILAQAQTLIDRGFAYVADDGSVYFEVGKFPAYGRLSGQKVEALRPGARVEVDRRKRSPEDFVIWKAATPGEPSWPSPWGPGRPGWHIEDTAITVRLLGARYDLHGAAVDLKFPHHEAEIALAESATGEAPLVNYWMHAAVVTMRGEKMSKSLGNTAALSEALDAFGAQVVRFFELNAHYRSPIDYLPGETFEEAREAYRRLAQPQERLAAELRAAGTERAGRELPGEVAQQATELVERLDATLADDFNTREAIALLFGWTRTVTDWLPHLASLSGTALASLGAPYRWGEEVLGLFAPASDAEAGLGAIIGVALEARDRARKRNDFAEADRIRDALRAAGIELEDDGGGTRWRLATPS